jgi:TonB-linked SusC/RagA family outer membrane protein
MNMRAILTFAFILLFFGVATLARAQETKTVSGTVVEAESGEAIPGANIIIKGTTKGTTTDLDGQFTIEASSVDILVVSFVGYMPQEWRVGDKDQFNIELVEAVTNLEEVVVVGYGTMKRSDLSSAQVTIDAEQLEQSRAVSIDQALQGRAAGVYVTRNSGQPGGGISVNIRGINSISSNTQPMYVIDGVQIMGSVDDNLTNALAGVNPDDIESMQILLGPSATAIYGSRASNGVIVITTKKGKSGKTTVSYSGTFGLQAPPELLPTMSLREYAEYQLVLSEVNNQDPPEEYLDPTVLGEGTNWQKELFRHAPIHKHQISLSGGSDKTTYYLSTQYLDQQGVALGSGFKRYSVRLNMDNQPNDWLKVGTSLMTSLTNEKLTFSDAYLIDIAIEQSPAIPVRNADGSWGGPPVTQYHLQNPVALAELQDHTRRRTFGMGSLFAEITPFKGFKFRTELNGNFQYTNDYQYDPSYQLGGYVKESNLSTRESKNNFAWNFNLLVQYSRTIGKHFFSVMASHEAQESTWETLKGSRDGFLLNTIQELDLGSVDNATNSSSKGDWAMESYFGRVNYVFNDRYILMGTLRADGSPSFGQNNRWGYFPSASAAWRISNEPFLQNVDALSNLKLRFDFGITGNQNSHGPTYYATMNPWPTPWGTGFLASNYSNPDFKWEKTKSYDIGLDLGLFSNRLELITDVYYKQTSNLMLLVPLPDYLGTGEGSSGEGNITPPWKNIGEMENTGLGIVLNTVNIQSPFVWSSNLNFSIDRNKLTKLYSENSLLDRTVWFMEGFISRSVIGQPLWQFYGYETEGLFQSIAQIENHSTQNARDLIDPDLGTWVGDVVFKENTGDTIIDERDRTFIGNPWPKFTFGFNNTFSYKNLELNIFLNGVYGNKIYNFQRFRNENPNGSGPGRGYLKTAADFARIGEDAGGNPYIINAGTSIPRISPNDANGNNKPSDIFVEDGSYLRVKNLQLSYYLPERWISKVFMSKLMVGVSIDNAFTFTKYKGYDPEIGVYVVDEYNSVVGIDYRRYPTSRIYSFIVSVDF